MWLALLALCTLPAQAPKKSDPSRWEKAIAAIEKRHRAKPPPKDGFLFVGSSSIVRWDLARSFPDLPVVNCGFGGSQLADSVHFAGRIVTPYAPKVVVLYAGDNDLGAGKTPEAVHGDFLAFVKAVHDRLPKAKVVFITIKPSIRRWKLIDKVRKANALVEATCKKDGRLAYVDVVAPMLGKDGQPRKELYVKDGLHLSAEGYKLWAELVKPHLK